MKYSKVSVPEIYKSSFDFRFFMKWFELALTRVQFDTENLFDLYDPLRCPSNLVWMLADTIGYKYDNRLPVSFNRLVLVYFMSMIRNRGSRDGMTLAAEVNLAQFNISEYGKEDEMMYDRLDDTSIPVNAVSVTAHTAEGYIDVVYFSDKNPIDACLEYVRPIGMYVFQDKGVRFDGRTRISVDARLVDLDESDAHVGPTHVGHYRREDFARLQKGSYTQLDTSHDRHATNYRNRKAEGESHKSVFPGYRALYSLQLCNNEHVVKSLIDVDPIFSLGYGPQDVDVTYPDDYLLPEYADEPRWNLRYDKDLDESITTDTYVNDEDRTESVIKPRPAVNPVMATLGDKIMITPTTFTKTDPYPEYKIIDITKEDEIDTTE